MASLGQDASCRLGFMRSARDKNHGTMPRVDVEEKRMAISRQRDQARGMGRIFVDDHLTILRPKSCQLNATFIS